MPSAILLDPITVEGPSDGEWPAEWPEMPEQLEILPINRANGSCVVGFANPQQAEIIKVYRDYSFEPRTHDDLLATVNSTPDSSLGRPNPADPTLPAAAFATRKLEAQTATTIEASWRGGHSIIAWDAVTYFSRIRDELLSLRDVTGASLGAVNADRITHFGIELGAGAQFADRLAGAPRHVVHLGLQYRPLDDWTLEAAVRWVPDKTPVDNMHALLADSHVLVDLRTEYRINERYALFGEITNLFRRDLCLLDADRRSGKA